ncbi:MAG: class I SAM-dependent methyltransferase [Solirubrobacterales bacterium]
MPELTVRSATEIYESGMDDLRSETDSVDYYAVGEDGTRRLLPIGRWLTRPPEDEELLLDRAIGPVLDVGCGPGRHLNALCRRGIDATGIDVSGYAVAIAREGQARVIHGSVFDVPALDEWETALLLDGNIGIGGDPRRLLARVAEFLSRTGSILVEVEPPQSETRSVNLRLEGPRDVSEWFPWAWVGADGIDAISGDAGLKVIDQWSTEGRWFAQLHLA